MISWLNYIVESSLVLALLLLFYKIILSKEKCIRYNRFYLLFTGAASIAFPLIDLPLINFAKSAPTIEPIYELPAIISQLTTFSASQPSGFESFLSIAGLIYLAGIIWVTILLLIKVGKLIILIRSSNPLIQHSKYKIILTHGIMPSFSFYNYLFLNEVDKTKEELNAIIAHEEAHITQKHSIDIILIEIHQIVFWFSPLSYMLAKNMRLNHEYLADYAVTKSIDKRAYINTLLRHIYNNTVLGVVHYFGLDSTEKRIKMIGQSINLRSLYKPYFSIPFISMLLFTFSCYNEALVIEPTKIGVEKAPTEFRLVMESLKFENPDRNYFFKLTSNVEIEKIIAQDFNQYSIDYEAPLKGYNEGSFGIIYSFDKYRSLPQEIFSSRVYKLQEVTQIPTPWEGYEHLLSSIDEYANNLISVNEDKVIWVKFVVTTIGSTAYTNVIMNKDMSKTDAAEYGAAIKAVNATASQWRVGKINETPVNVVLEIPVRLRKMN